MKKMKIGDIVKVKDDLTENSVAYIQRGKVGTIVEIDFQNTFPYRIDFNDESNSRMNWFWENHLVGF